MPEFAGVAEMLVRHALPGGLLPALVAAARLDDATGAFEVTLSRPFERLVTGVRVRYATRIGGVLGPGRIDALTGVEAKVLVWVAVNAIRTEGDDLAFVLGPVRRRVPRAEFA
jgi:hypothetical protein